MGLSGNETAIRDLDAEIDRISSAIQIPVNDKRRALRTQLNSELLFFRLPPEICIAIFSFACHKGRLSLLDQELVTTPFVISSICHAWRAMTRSAPELWSSVSLCVDPSKEGSVIQAELLDQWLRLAKASPLSISITFDQNEVYKWNPVFNGFVPLVEAGVVMFPGLPTAVISVAASYSHQWELLDLFLPSDWAGPLRSTMGRIPNLKSLNLQYLSNNSTSSLFSKTFLDAPKLRTVTLDCENIDVGLPWHQLEDLIILGYDTATRLALLRKSSNLTFCRVIKRQRHKANSSSQAAQHTPVHLSKLISLEIIDSQLSLLSYIVAPVLESIAVSLRDVSQIQAFSAFLTRSDIALQRLSIIENIREEEDFLKLLDTLPHLSHLELDEVELFRSFGGPTGWLGLTRNFFDYLKTPNMTRGSLPLPALTSLKYGGQIKFKFPDGSKWHKDGADDGVDVDTTEKMLLARWNTKLSSYGTSQLQVFSMTVIGSPEAADELERSPVVEGLRKEGMHLVFESVKRRPSYE